MGKKKKRKKKKICPHRAFTPNQVALPPACGGVHCSLATVPTTPYSLPHTKGHSSSCSYGWSTFRKTVKCILFFSRVGK